ncbi:type II secretion system minor pseudopilin GspJ [Thiorhodospira sibirica]|uniref:type II secretion system minor pseudopilin GspJ n=1 Tax=Thiorhodospira sibirica TaxID=154347 RepID=UPI00022C04B7|nr:type II secretion system minor pseudopilin GspJ [Thiorhodospira sibirica]
MTAYPFLSASQRGFTLLELLVALAVFSVVSMMAYAGLRVVLDARTHTDQAAAQLAELQITLTVLARDLEQVVERSVRDTYGDRHAVMRYSPYTIPRRLEFVRTRTRTGPQKSALQRVAWELHEGALERLSWAVLDGAAEESVVRVPLLGQRASVTVTTFEVYFYHPMLGERSETWPPLGTGGTQFTGLPSGVEIELELEGLGRITRLFALSPSS